jgi:serine/threonine protein kinase
MTLINKEDLINIKPYSENYAHLFSAYNKLSKTNVIIKKYDNFGLFLTEKKIMEKITISNHTNPNNYIPIPEVYGFIDYSDLLKDPEYGLVMKKINAPDLISCIEDKGMIKINRLKVIIELVKIINDLHHINIAHRDIKCDNILVKLPKIMGADIKVVLIDFAFSKEVINNKKEYGRLGTVNYYSPELFFKGKYNPKDNDVWSLGVVIYILATKGYYPYLYPKGYEGKLRANKLNHKDRKYYLKSFYNSCIKKIKYIGIDQGIVSILKKIFVRENNRIKIGELKERIIVNINNIINNNNEFSISMSPKRHIQSSSF